MRLIDLHINGFGKFHSYALEFAPGVNIIYGRNEAGKSTLHSYIRAMLFGLDKKPGRSGKRELYEALEPWETPEIYAGRLRFLDDETGETYCISRDFAAAPEDLVLQNETKGVRETGEPAHTHLSTLLGGLTETAYLNTVSIGQLKAATGREMAAELRRYVRNLNTTGSIDLSAEAAIDYLKQEKRGLLRFLQPDAVQTYAKTVGRIKNLEVLVNAPGNENRIVPCTARRNEAEEELSRNAAARKEVEARIDKANQTLAASFFTDEASIRRYEAETKQLFADWSSAGKKAKSALFRVLPCMLLLLCFGAAAIAFGFFRADVSGSSVGEALRAALLLPGGGNPAGGALLTAPPALLSLLAAPAGTAAAVFLGLALLLLLAAVLLFRRGSLYGQKKKECAAVLSERLLTHLGHGEISSEAMERFAERMAGFVKLSQAAEASRAELRKLQSEAAELGRKKDLCQEAIGQQQRIASSVEQQLTELYMLKNQAAELRQIIAENEKLKAKTDAIDIAIETLGRLGESIQSSVGMYLNQEAGLLISGITGGAYRSMDVGPSMEIYLNTRTRMVPLESVSAGTMDQVYLALRMAAVRLIEGKNGRLPLIFDDSFVLYDDDRLKHAVSFVAKERGGQILLFTCHHREEKALEELGIPFQKLRITK